MTEGDWLNCTNPQARLKFLRDKTSDRKLRLFGVACCRRLWRLLRQELRSLVEVIEQYSDGRITAGELHAVHTLVHPQEAGQAGNLAAEAVRCCADLGYFISREKDEKAGIALTAYYALGAVESEEWASVMKERPAQVALLDDIMGNPFHPVALKRSWHTPAVSNLARAAYEERHLPEGTLDQTRLAVLADALEEAGCDDADILHHFRSLEDHVRGCWAVDLLLGKE